MKKPSKDQAFKASDENAARARRKPAARSAGGKPAKGTFEATVTVVNKRGLHARAAAKFVKLAGTFEAEVKVTAVWGGLAGSGTVSGSSIMGLMMLGAAPGSDLLIETSGREALAALDALSKLVAGGFDEED